MHPDAPCDARFAVLSEPAAVALQPDHRTPGWRALPQPTRLHAAVLYRAATALLLLIAAVMWALYFMHLRADFPNHSPWVDWAKYTDEGWYGDGAIRHFGRGSWYVAGDFNPAAALPVLPLLEAAVFRFTGVGVVPARALSVALFGAILLASFALVCRVRLPGGSRPSLAAAASVLLLAVNPFCYAFMRMAILEPLLVLLTLMALLLADTPPSINGRWPRRVLRIAALGALLPLMVLTKTTAVCLLPAIFWLLWARGGYRLRPLVRDGGGAIAMALVLWSAYYAIAVRPRYAEDFRYVFSANAYTGITLGNAPAILLDTVRDTSWTGGIAWVGSLVLLLGLALLRLEAVSFLRRQPIVAALVLWMLGYAAFLAYHDNLQPRYYLVIAVPLTLLVPLTLKELWSRARGWPPRLAVLAAAGLLGVVAVRDARQTLRFLREPEYSFFAAAQGIAQIVRADPARSPLVLSISGSDLSLMTGVPSICDDFGTMDLDVRVAAYRPGWYAAWNQVDDDKMDALAPLYHLHRVAAFPAMDDPERNLLILYRLDPPTGEPRPGRRRGSPPRRLETRLGQQPSVTQLQH